jgi:hypothetical protein
MPIDGPSIRGNSDGKAAPSVPDGLGRHEVSRGFSLAVRACWPKGRLVTPSAVGQVNRRSEGSHSGLDEMRLRRGRPQAGDEGRDPFGARYAEIVRNQCVKLLEA